jgi:hypothetical protein
MEIVKNSKSTKFTFLLFLRKNSKKFECSKNKKKTIKKHFCLIIYFVLHFENSKYKETNIEIRKASGFTNFFILAYFQKLKKQLKTIFEQLRSSK